MSTRGDDLLEARQSAVKARLEQALGSNAPLAEIEPLAAELELLKSLAPAKPDTPTWKTALSLVLVAVLLIAVAALMSVPNPTISVDAKVTGFGFVVGDGGTPFEMTNPVSPTAFEIAGDLVGEKVPPVATIHSLQAISVPAKTRVTVQQRGPRCIQIDTSGPIRFVLATKPEKTSDLPSPLALNTVRSSSVYLCLPRGGEFASAGPLSEFQIARVHREDSPRLLLSSTVSGSLRVAATGREMKLGEGERISLKNVRNGWLVLTVSDGMRTAFSGSVGVAEQVGVSPALDRQTIAPSLLDVLATSPKITSLFASLTALLGLLWTVRKYVLPSS